MTGSVADIWIGDEVALRPEETGWQDTAEVDPHQMMAIVATFDKAGDYVWHCHILSHEDNEMMRALYCGQRSRLARVKRRPRARAELASNRTFMIVALRTVTERGKSLSTCPRVIAP